MQIACNSIKTTKQQQKSLFEYILDFAQMKKVSKIIRHTEQNVQQATKTIYIFFSLTRLYLVNNLFWDYHLCTFVMLWNSYSFNFSSCGCIVTHFTPIYPFLSSLLHLQKCLLKVHQGASMDALSMSLHLPLILTLLRLSQKDHPSGHLMHSCHSVYRKHTKDFTELQTNHREG